MGSKVERGTGNKSKEDYESSVEIYWLNSGKVETKDAEEVNTMYHRLLSSNQNEEAPYPENFQVDRQNGTAYHGGTLNFTSRDVLTT